ncbi:tetratricopeptide repeat protein [Geomonas nitrogeniifigens]|uniref:tetratricopeptide repeat protein n=1 Tax=Geomonas diazotrophica TaxID=2843197 RepID=UPI001C2C9780|nr:tetratricopeptide repeat protein [Geomonas nitrogeniifigens]QXE86212.1 tetratricopeptide repeat protein [Geomonas nitrogeniifigens]
MAADPGTAQEFARALELQRAGRLQEAEPIYRRLAQAGGGRAAGGLAADVLINLGALLDETGRHEEALEEYRRALSLRDGDPMALNNMGSSLFKLGRFAEAADLFRLALQKAPDAPEPAIALGGALQRAGDVQGAIACFRDLVRRRPDCADAHWNLALALIMSGEFREGWAEYQWRWKRDAFTSPLRGFHAPAWDGAPLDGRRILVHGEQGLGDTIQFARYLPMVAQQGGVVIAECQSAALVPLLRGMPGVAEVCVMGEPLPPFDLEVPLLSLPHLFDTTIDTVPNRVPYLAPPPGRLVLWQAKLSRDAGFKVGLVWAGKAVPDPFRSCSLAALAPLFGIPGASLYSLQVGEGAARPGECPNLIDLTHSIRDFGDTAALVAQLDLVISIDTSVAHLAGALGKPVWLLLPMAGDYRWLCGRDDSPWYPTMRLLRQQRQGEWGEVVERLRALLSDAVWDHLQRRLSSRPFEGGSHHLCGAFLAAAGRPREATARFTKAAQLLPDRWEPQYALAQALQQMGRFPEAEASIEAALALADGLPHLHEALGIVKQVRGDLEGALPCYRRALELDPSLQKARYNLATACKDLGRFQEALSEFREVVRRFPDYADAHWNLAVLLLMTGELPQGWREFSWRFKKSSSAPLRRWQEHPAWDGAPLSGRTILLYGEQGAGDTLQFVRYAPLVAGRGGRVLVEVQSAGLVELVRGVAGVDEVFACGDSIPPFELQASLMDLPGIFGTDLAGIPARVPYLETDPARREACATLFPADGTLRVGLAWQGNPAHPNDPNRSLPPERLARLAAVPGVSFYSLQLGARGDLAALLPMIDLAPNIGDYADTAALASRLDLVLSVDTSVAHLAGALGLPVWLLVPFVPDWRWLLDRDDTPWYPTMRLFRQRSRGDWDGVLQRVAQALDQLAQSKNGRTAPQEDPVRQAERYNDEGCTLDGAGRQEEAIERYREAIALHPDFVAPHYNMGNSLYTLGRHAEAVDCYRRALAVDPNLAQGWHNLALALKEQGELEAALHALKRAVSVAPDYLEARHNLGELYHALGDLDLAQATFRGILAADPGYLPSWNALGIALQVQERLEEAAQCYRRALALNPDYLHALNNLGSVSRALGEVDEAVRCYRKVLALDPGYADAHWNLALVQLQLGQYREGWQGYEWRFAKVDPIPRLELPRPLWDGSPLKGKTILLHAEQGFGDTFQFVRYAPLLAAQGATVLLQCQAKPIAAVLATVPGVSRVLVRGERLPEFDCHAPLMSLPYLCGTLLETIPAQIPYLAADPALVERWHPALPGEGFRVGLVWAGRKSYKDDLKRSLTLSLFAPLARVPGVRFCALQVGDGAEQAATPPPGMELTDLGSGIKSFADTAAILTQLDLVISADTAVAHLAGGLGVPVWVLLPMACDWRWLMQREDSPWYPSARLFRQRYRGDWGEVLERVARQLALLAGRKGER